MDIRGVSYGDVQRIIARVSAERYAGNVTSAPDAQALRAGGQGFRGRLIVADSYGRGARTSASGRHGPYACWHAYRDVMAAIFDEYPDARIRAGRGPKAYYRGREGFLRDYPATGRVNVGSIMNPARFQDLCVVTDDRAHTEPGPAAITEPVPEPAEPVTVAARERFAENHADEADAAYLRALHNMPPREAETQHLTRPDVPTVINEIDDLLAEVAAQGWTNPYTDPDSPALRLAG